MSGDSTTARSFAQFVEEKRTTLVRYIRSKIEADAEDIFQDVVAAVWGKGDDLEAIDDIGAYVTRAINNRIIDGYRKRAREEMRKALIQTGDLEDAKNVDAYDALERSEIGKRINLALMSLSEKERAVWTAIEIEGRSFKDLSREWNESANTLLSRKHRANKKLRQLLADLK